MKAKTRLLGGMFAVFATCSLLYAFSASAGPITGTLYYTTFAGGTNVDSVNFNYDGTSTLALTGITGIAATPGADGLLFAPDGNLIVAGQSTNNLYEVTTSGGAVTNVYAGTGAYHMALSSNSPTATLYTLANGGFGSYSIGGTTLAGGGLANNGVAYTVVCADPAGGCSVDVRGLAYNTNNGKWYYGTAPDGGAGDFGTVVFDDTLHTATLTVLAHNVYAHGLTFDPFTNDIIFSSANYIEQYQLGVGIVSSTIGTGNFDQSAVDGKGHLFVASNSGYLEFVDYSGTGLIGAAGDFQNEQFLAYNLDDIAPLSGVGSQNPIPEPNVLVLLGIGILGLTLARRRSFLGVCQIR